MSDTSPSPKTRKLLAGVAAVVLTLGAAGAAVAVNLGTGAAVDTPAGRLSATEPIGTAEATTQVTPSTIYVDVTVPVSTTAAGVPVPGAPAPTDPAAAQAPSASSDDDGYERDDDSHDSDDDSDESDDHEESEHEEGSDDDD